MPIADLVVTSIRRMKRSRAFVAGSACGSPTTQRGRLRPVDVDHDRVRLRRPDCPSTTWLVALVATCFLSSLAFHARIPEGRDPMTYTLLAMVVLIAAARWFFTSLRSPSLHRVGRRIRRKDHLALR